jgi:predicted MFS family arabinose efflux permease
MFVLFVFQASQKGMSETISGLVFSFYALIMFVSSPLFGKIVSDTKKKRFKMKVYPFTVTLNYKCKFNCSTIF